MVLLRIVLLFMLWEIFICDQNAENTHNSIILNLSLSFDSSDKKLSFDNISYIPIHMYKNPNVSSHKFKLLNIEKSIARFEAGLDTSIGKSKYEDLKVQLQKIKIFWEINSNFYNLNIKSMCISGTHTFFCLNLSDIQPYLICN